MTLAPVMARSTDPEESHLFDQSVSKEARSMTILQRLKAQSPQTYRTLCDFNANPAAYRTLLTNLEREGLVVKVGRMGRAGAFALTDKGKRVVA